MRWRGHVRGMRRICGFGRRTMAWRYSRCQDAGDADMSAQGDLWRGWVEDPVQYVSTTRAQLEPMLRVLDAKRLLNGGHWVSPTAGHGEVPRLCAEILPELGRPLPTQWTCYELGSVARPNYAAQWARVVEWRPESDFTRLPNMHEAKDVCMVLDNFPWGRGAPSIKSLVTHCWRLYPYAHVVALYAWERAALDWTRNGEENAAWIAAHGPDVYMLGRGRGLQQFAGASDDLNNLCGWLHWVPDRRERDHTVMRWL